MSWPAWALLQGDVVIRQGDPGNVMYFIAAGKLEVRQYNLGKADGAGSAREAERVHHKFSEPLDQLAGGGLEAKK